MRKRYFFSLVLFMTILGCAGVRTSLENYEACKGDVDCMRSVEQTREAAFAVSRSAVNSAFPSTADALALIISNGIAFAVGVWRGGRLKSK